MSSAINSDTSEMPAVAATITTTATASAPSTTAASTAGEQLPSSASHAAAATAAHDACVSSSPSITHTAFESIDSSSSSNKAADVLATDVDSSGRCTSLEPRSATFSGSLSPAISSAALWHNKAVSCERIRAFEATRKAQIDASQDKDRAYWQRFEHEIVRAKDENARLQKFFALRLQADLAYADALRRIRHAVEQPAATVLPTSTTSTAATTGTAEPFNVLSTCAKALNTLGEVQQQMAEKLTQFASVVRRDVVLRPLDDMVATFDERAAAMRIDGQRLDQLLSDAQRSVVNAFSTYDALYRDMERDRSISTNGISGTNTSDTKDKRPDLWLAEVAYSVHVHRLQAARVAYVKGMAALFQQFKALEVVRVSVVQTALDTYIRKQKLLYDELAGGMSEPMAAVHRIEPERDLLHSVRRIPKNFTAAALSAESAEQTLFASLRSPLASPLLVRCGFLKHHVSGSLFRTWKDVLCAITQDAKLHVLELHDSATQAIASSSDAMLAAISLLDATHDVASTTVSLVHCRVEIVATSSTVPSFEVTELLPPTGLFGSMFQLASTRKLLFQCASQSDLLEWVVAAKRFV